MDAMAKDRAAELTTRLLSVSAGLYNPVDMSEEDVDFVLDNIKTIIMKRPMLVEIKAPTHVLGDIHGQYFDLLRVFEVIGFPEKDNQMLFLGDYVDRGRFGLETVMLLFSFKIQYPDQVHLLRGNHESKAVSRVYGFYEECKQRFNSPKVWKRFMDVFDCLPVAAIINKAILCMHGGLSPQLKDYQDIKRIPRPSDIPQTGIMADLLWPTPTQNSRPAGRRTRAESRSCSPPTLCTSSARRTNPSAPGCLQRLRNDRRPEDAHTLHGAELLWTVRESRRHRIGGPTSEANPPND